MADKIKLRLSVIVNPDPSFISSLDRLGEVCDPKDRYAIARLRTQAEAELKTFSRERDRLVKKHGTSEVEILDRRIALIRASAAPDEKAIAVCEERKPKVEGSFLIETDNFKAREAFQQDIDALLVSEIETYLDHRVSIPASTNLTSKEMSVLLDIIEVNSPVVPSKES